MKKFLITLFLLGFMAIPAIAADEEIQNETEKTVFDKNEIITNKFFKISAVDPKKTDNSGDDLVIYTKLFGRYTGSDMRGYEAVVVDNRVIQLNQGNSYIPQNGYVISGHGKAKKFILENLFEGADVSIDFDNSKLVVQTHPDNYLYEANYRLEKIKKTYETSNKENLDNEKIEFYIKRAEDLLNTTKKLILFEDYENAYQMAQDSIVYSDMALYFTLLYDADEFKGIKVFPYQKTENEVRQAFNAINNLGINNIFIETYYNGMTIYKSEVQEQYKLPAQNRYYGEFDPLATWIALAKEHGKNVYATINAFNLGNVQKSTIKTNVSTVYPEWKFKADNDELYLNPENEQVQRYIMALIDEVSKKYEIAGVNITGLNVPMKNPTAPIKEFMNKVSAYQMANENANFFVDIYPFSTDIKNWTLNENITLCPVLTSSDIDFTQNFLNEIKDNSFGARILPVYTEPYLEEKPRTLFEQLTVARNMGVKGVILYNLDYITKEYTNALKYSLFNSPSEKKQEGSYIQMNYNEDKAEAKEEVKQEEVKKEETEVKKEKKVETDTGIFSETVLPAIQQDTKENNKQEEK